MADASALSSVTEVVWRHAQGTGWYLFIGLALAVCWWGWRAYGLRASGVLGTLARLARCGALLGLVAVLADPVVITTTTTTTPGRILVVVDDSASMSRADLPGEQSRTALVTDLAAALAINPTTATADIDWFTISDTVEPLDPAAAITADGSRSPIGDRLEQLALARSPDLVVLLSDGRVTAGSQLAASAARLAQANVPKAGVWVLASGGEAVEPELRLVDAEAPSDVARGERQPIRARLASRALAGQPAIVTLRLGERELDRQELVLPSSDDPGDLVESEFTLEASIDEVGSHRLQLTVEHAGQPPLSDTLELNVSVIERSLQVLILAHRPRYENRYLLEALRRDRTVTVHAYLADGGWRRWGDARSGPEQLPTDPESLRGYDAVIVGDIAADALAGNVPRDLTRAVRRDGVGLLWLPGSTGGITSLAGTDLGELIPAQLDERAVAGYRRDQPRRASATRAAEARNLLVPEGRDWSSLPPLRGALDLRPEAVAAGAEVLLVDQDQRPLVIIRPYDAGRVALVGVDDTWRWRRGVDDRYLHRFYSELLRYLAASRSPDGVRWRLVASPTRALPGETVRLGLAPDATTLDPADLPESVAVGITGSDGTTQVVRLRREPDDLGFSASLPAPQPGRWQVAPSGATNLPGAAVPTIDLVVLEPADEQRDPRRDLVALTELADGTGGETVAWPAIFADPDQAADYNPAVDLVSRLPATSRSRRDATVTALWDRWWVLAVIVGLLAIDWSIRRASRLP